MKRKHTGLFVKFLLSYISFVLLITILMGGIAHFFAVRAYNEEIERMSVGTVRQFQRILKANIVDRAVQIATQVTTGETTCAKLEALLESDMPQPSEISSLHKEIRNLVLQNLEAVDAIHIYDRKHSMILSSKLGVSYVDRAYGLYQYTHDWIDLQYGHTSPQWISTRPSPYPGNGGRVLTFVCNNPMNSSTQVNRGYIAVDLYEKALRDICAVLTEEAGAALYIVDGAGRLLTHQDEHLIGADMDSLGMLGLDSLDAASSGSFAYQVNGIGHYACYSEPLSNGWRLILSKPTHSFYEASRLMQGRLIAGSLGAILLGLLLAYGVTVRMYRPVRSLANRLGITVSGALPPPDETRNEYAFIDRAVYSMSAELSSLRQRLERNQELLKSNLVNSLINNTVHSPEALRQRMDLIGEVPRGSHFGAVCLSLSDTLVHSPQYENVELIKLNLCAWLEDLSDSDTLYLASETRDDELVALVFAEDTDMQETLEEIAFHLQEQCQGHIRMSVGLWQESPLDLHIAYRSARDVQRYTFFHPEWPYCAAEVIRKAVLPEADILAERVRAVAEALREGRAGAATEAMGRFVRAVQEALHPYAYLSERFEELQSAIREGICLKGHREREAFLARFDALQKKTLNGYADACCTLLREMLPEEGAPVRKNAATVAMLQQYIQRNLAGDLSLTRLSEIMGLSASYLSRTFKEETQINLIDYITSERFERARQLIEQTDLSIASITLQVGYPTHHYFSKRFKERYGASPKDYRRSFRIRQVEPMAAGGCFTPAQKPS